MFMKELQERSRRCHELVRESLLSDKIENEALHNPLRHYLSYWNDFSHSRLFSIACQAVGQKPDGMVQPQGRARLIQPQLMWRNVIEKQAEARFGVKFRRRDSTVCPIGLN